ncbi:MAG TPA: VOC family protein [Acidimicrobiia bacterium]|jgi:2,3-dihydroxybiphenyl 1,2-dioxygenase
MERQLELAYLVLEVPEPDRLTPVFADVVGLVPGEPTPRGERTWRDDDRVHRLILQPGAASDAVAVGFEAIDTNAFDTTLARVRALGLDAREVDDDARDRRVDRLARVRAPWGGDVEIVLGLAEAATPFSSTLVPGGFLTDEVGFGHVVFATVAFDESTEFLTGGLGFAQSDWLETELAPGIALEVRFYHCNARHHTVALARAPFALPQVLHHVMFEMNERDDVGTAFDRLWASDLGIPNGLGRHDNDGMFSFYLQTPVGFQIEVGHGARVIGDSWDDDRRYDSISAWGHQALRSP